MKKAFFCILTVGLLVVSCNKYEDIEASVDAAPVEMTFGVQGDGLEMEVTKGKDITSVSQIYWSATTGTAGSDTEKYSRAQLTLANSKFSTGKYWPATSTSYNYYVSNAEFTWNSSAHSATIAATNATDIVAAVQKNVAWKDSPTITAEHIFARTGSLTLTAQSGYTLKSGSPVTWKIQSNTGGGTAGTYNIATKAWSGTLTALEQTTFTSSSDLYLIPGSYKISITYTLTKGDYTREFTKSANVTLTAGNVNNISATAHVGDQGAQEIVLNVDLKPWGTNDITIAQGDLK